MLSPWLSPKAFCTAPPPTQRNIFQIFSRMFTRLQHMSPGLPPACRSAFLQVCLPVRADLANTHGAPTLQLSIALNEPYQGVRNVESRCQRCPTICCLWGLLIPQVGEGVHVCGDCQQPVQGASKRSSLRSLWKLDHDLKRIQNRKACVEHKTGGGSCSSYVHAVPGFDILAFSSLADRKITVCFVCDQS